MPETPTKFPVKNQKPAPMQTEGWRPFESLRREIDRLFDDMSPFGWGMPGRPMFGPELPKARQTDWPVVPAMDLIEKDHQYEISAELPGLDEKNVEIKLANGVLTIKGEKSDEKEDKQKDYYLSERRYGSFQRAFQVPDGVDAENIDASFAKGVLTVTLPKSTEAKQSAKKIEVKAA